MIDIGRGSGGYEDTQHGNVAEEIEFRSRKKHP
jgi:hypothetical protein